MEVSIATINDPLLSDRDMAVFARDVDVKHTMLGGTLVQNVIVRNGGREGNETITGHFRRDSWPVEWVGYVEWVGVWSVEGGWQGEAYIHLWNEQTVTVAYTEYCFSSGQN